MLGTCIEYPASSIPWYQAKWRRVPIHHWWCQTCHTGLRQQSVDGKRLFTLQLCCTYCWLSWLSHNVTCNVC